MPFKKFRDVSEIPDIWHEPGSPELFRAIKNVWEFAELTVQPRFPPGVYKFRSIEEMKKNKEVWERANVDAYQERQRLIRESRRQSSVRDTGDAED